MPEIVADSTQASKSDHGYEASFSEESTSQPIPISLGRLSVSLESLPHEIAQAVLDRSRRPNRLLSIGRYVILRELGRGGMGVVYEAWDPSIERRVAIKTLHPNLISEEDREETVERFRREARVVGRLRHPAIVTIYDTGSEYRLDEDSGKEEESLHYYVMEFLVGRTLEQCVDDHGPLSPRKAMEVVADIAEALEICHRAGVIHRDVKQSNVFMRNESEPILIDFGIAKTNAATLTREGQIVGTPSYLAPERLIEDEIPIDGRADIFSLGVLLYTLVTGKAPFMGQSPAEVFSRIMSVDFPPLPPSYHKAAIEGLLRGMLAKRPEDRPDSAGLVADRLRDILGSELRGDRSSVAPTQTVPALTAPSRSRDPVQRPISSFSMPEGKAPTLALTHAPKLSTQGSEPDTLLDSDADASEMLHPSVVEQSTFPELALMRETRQLATAELRKAGLHELEPETFDGNFPEGGTLPDVDIRDLSLESVERPFQSLAVSEPHDDDATQVDFSLDASAGLASGTSSAPPTSHGRLVRDPAEQHPARTSEGDRNFRMMFTIPAARALSMRGLGKNKKPRRHSTSMLSVFPPISRWRRWALYASIAACAGLVIAMLVIFGGAKAKHHVLPDRASGPSWAAPRVSPKPELSLDQHVIPLVRPRPATELLEAAERARNEGSLAKAERLYDSALRASPLRSRLEARAMLGWADTLRASGQTQEAAELYRELMTHHGDRPEAQQAQIALRDVMPDVPVGGAPVVPSSGEKRAVARNLSKRASTVTEESPVLPMDPCVEAISLPKTQASVARLDAMARAHPDKACVALSLGNLHFLTGDYRASILAFERYLRLEPDSPKRGAIDARVEEMKRRIQLGDDSGSVF
jgi:serine/threonine protein kinase/tetratricopeptide (TPR) repeat protein